MLISMKAYFCQIDMKKNIITDILCSNFIPELFNFQSTELSNKSRSRYVLSFGQVIFFFSICLSIKHGESWLCNSQDRRTYYTFMWALPCFSLICKCNVDAVPIIAWYHLSLYQHDVLVNNCKYNVRMLPILVGNHMSLY